MPRSGSSQCSAGLLDLPLEDRPQRLGDLLARTYVQIDRVEDRTPDVVLLLRVRAVADAYGLRPLVAPQVGQRRLLQLALTADAVHDLEVRAVAAAVGDEVEEVVGLAVEAQGVEAPQRERRVAYPRVPVVPVALAVRRLGEGCRRGGEQRPGGRVRQSLEGERARLEVVPPRDGRGTRRR